MEMSGRYNTATMFTAIVVVICLGAGSLWFAAWLCVSSSVHYIICWLACSCGDFAFFNFFLKISENYSRIWFSTMLMAGGALSLLLRLIAFLLLRRLRASGINLKTVLLVGSGGSLATRLKNEGALMGMVLRWFPHCLSVWKLVG